MSREIEFKFRVADDAALDTFAAALGLVRAQHPARLQQNTFFDSADGRLRAHRLALRLRVEDERGTLTVKGRDVARSADAVLLERFEAEQPVEKPDFEAVLAGSLSPLSLLEGSTDPAVREGLATLRAALGSAALVQVGSFQNERTTLPAVDIPVAGHTERLVFELDRTSFPGGRVDHEIEVEIDDRVDAEALREHLDDLLQRAEVPWVPSSSKFARLLELIDTR